MIRDCGIVYSNPLTRVQIPAATFLVLQVIHFTNFETKWKKIGVLGGMGPMSTVRFYQYLIELCQRRYYAKYDSDFPEILIYNLPIPDVVENIENEEKTKKLLINGIRQLENAGCDFIAIPCNTVNFCIDFLRAKSKIEIISIVEETANKVNKSGTKNATLLATEKTIQSGMYQDKIKKEIKLFLPEKQKEITNLILEILAGCKESKKLGKTIKNCKSEAVILGCTDLSGLIDEKTTTIKIFDSLIILAEATIEKAKVN